MIGYWQDETSGELAKAVVAYLTNDGPLAPEHVTYLRAYFRQWMAGDWRGEGLEELRRDVDGLDSREAIGRWLGRALALSIDPL